MTSSENKTIELIVNSSRQSILEQSERKGNPFALPNRRTTRTNKELLVYNRRKRLRLNLMPSFSLQQIRA